MPSTSGLLSPPLGLTRLQVSRLLSTLVQMNLEDVNSRLAELGTVGALLVNHVTPIYNSSCIEAATSWVLICRFYMVQIET